MLPTASIVRRISALTEDARLQYPLLGPNPIAFINTTFVFVAFGQVSLILLIATVLFSPYVYRRNVTLINLLVLTVIASVPPAVLYYSGHILDPHPPFSLCISQAILKHGTDAMFITASLALIIELLIEMRLLSCKIRPQYRKTLLVALPYLTFLIFGIWAAVLGLRRHKAVQHLPNSLSCTISYTSFGRGVDIFCAVVVTFTISLECYIHFRYRKIWRDVNYTGPMQGFSTVLIARLLGFTSLQLFYLVLLALDFFVGSVATHAIPIVYEALMPFATFLIFGTSKDCMETWMFWKQKDRRRSIDESDDDGSNISNDEKFVNVDLESGSTRQKQLPPIPYDA